MKTHGNYTVSIEDAIFMKEKEAETAEGKGTFDRILEVNESKRHVQHNLILKCVFFDLKNLIHFFRDTYD